MKEINYILEVTFSYNNDGWMDGSIQPVGQVNSSLLLDGNILKTTTNIE